MHFLMVLRLLQPLPLDALIVEAVAFQLVVLALMVQLVLALKRLVPQLLPRQLKVLLQFR